MKSYRDNVLVLSRDGIWCRAKKKKSLRYADSISTLCDMFVTLPYRIEKSGIERTTCPDCRRVEREIDASTTVQRS